MLNLKSIFSILLIGSVLVSTAQSIDGSQYSESVLAAAQESGKAAIDMDVSGIVNYTHPVIIEAMGGPDVMQQFLTEALNSMADQGFVIESWEAQAPREFVREQGEIRCLVPNTAVFDAGEVKINSSSFLLGFSMDEGKSWVFMEAAKVKSPEMAAIMPNFKTSIDIPDDVREVIPK